MRFITTLALATVLAAPAIVQTAVAQTAPAHPTMHSMRHHAPAKHKAMGQQRGNAEDQGPFTPEANRAYDGGGAILEGAPGGPPPPASAVSSMPTGRPLPPAR
jgi:hypothetical protein